MFRVLFFSFLSTYRECVDCRHSCGWSFYPKDFLNLVCTMHMARDSYCSLLYSLICRFTGATICYSAMYAMALCLSVCLSVCQSQCCIDLVFWHESTLGLLNNIVLEGNSVISKTRVFPSGTFPNAGVLDLFQPTILLSLLH